MLKYDRLTYDLNEIIELASGNKKKHVPFAYLISQSDALIDNVYAPSGFVWKDPRNLTKESIQELLNHIRCRQEKYGPHEGFRFHSYVKAKEIVKAQYGINVNTQRAAERNKKQQSCRKKKKDEGTKSKKNGKKTVALPEGSLDPAADPSVTAVHRNVTAAQGNATAAHGNATAVCTVDQQLTQIDPALLGEDELTTLVQNTATDGIRHPQDSGGYVDDIGMQLLIANGFPNTIPVNGPQDGPPKYFVSAAAIQFLSNQTRVHSTSDDIVSSKIDKSTNANTKYGGTHKSNEEVTVQRPRRSERVKENDKTQQRQTRSQKREGAKKR